jgi:hypothetical protein
MPFAKASSGGFVPPCIPARAAKPSAGPDWVHEIKHDGYRLQVRRDGDAVRLFTRRGYDWSGRYRFVQPTSVASGWRHFWTFRPEIDPGLRRLELGKRKGKRVRKLPTLEAVEKSTNCQAPASARHPPSEFLEKMSRNP